MTFFKFTHNKDDFFSSFFSKITLIMIATVILLSVAVYAYSSHSILNIAYESNSELFSQMGYMASKLDEQIKSVGVVLLNNPYVSTLFNSKSIDSTAVNNAFSQIMSMINTNPSIYSAYIHNSATDTYYITGKSNLVRQGDFYDSEISTLLNNSASTGVPIIRSIPVSDYDTSEYINVFTYIFFDSYVENTTRNALVLNIKIDDFLKYLTSDNNKKTYGQIYLLAKNGILIDYRDNSTSFSNALDEKYVKKILSSDSGHDYFIENVEGQKSVIFSQFFKYPDWGLLNVIPYKNFSASINSFRIIIILIALLIIMLSVNFSYLMSKRMYLPIKDIFNKIHKLSRAKKTDSSKTLTGISQSIDLIQKEITSLDTFKRNNMHFVKNECLKKFLHNPESIEHNEENYLFFPEDYNYDDSRLYFITVYKLDNFDNFSEMSYDDQSLYKYAFINIAGEITENEFDSEFVDDAPDYIVSISSADLHRKNEIYTTQKKLAEQISCEYNKHFGFTVSAFISETTNDYRDINELYNTTTELSFYRLFLGHNSVFSKEDYDRQNYSAEWISSDEIKPLTDMINLEKPEDSQNELHKILMHIKTCEHKSVIVSLIKLATSIFNIIDDSNENLALFTDDILKLETIELIEERFNELILYIYETKKLQKSNRSTSIITQIISYIEGNYSDPNLSSKSIADVVNLSPRYAAKLFYDSEHITLQNYITGFRIEISKDLLCGSKYTIKEIVNKIGWSNVKYFYTVFKKSTGLTPSEYRKKAHNCN